MSKTSTVVQTQKEKTNPKVAFGYGMGEVASQMSWYMINTYLTIFYTDVVGLTASAISFIMLVARVWDAMNDPIMGNIVDNTNSKWGRFKPYLMFAPPFLAIFNILTFTVWPVEGTMKVVLCLVAYVGAGMAYTVVNTAHIALINVLAKDSDVRTNLGTARGIGGAVISIILSAVVMPMILFFGNSDVATAEGYFKTVVVLSIILIPCFLIEAYLCKETYTEQIYKVKNENTEKVTFATSFKLLLKNDQMFILVINTFLGAFSIIARMSLLAYYIIYVIGDYTIIATVYTTITVAQLVGTVLVPFGCKFFGKRNYMIILNVIMAVSFIAIYFLGDTSNTMLLGLSFICGFTGSAGTITNGMVPDCIDYGAWKLGTHQAGLAASFLSLSVKLATALIGVIGVWALAAVGYVPNAEQTDSAKNGINMVVNILPAITVAISIIPICFYKLDAKRVAEIRQELEAREQ